MWCTTSVGKKHTRPVEEEGECAGHGDALANVEHVAAAVGHREAAAREDERALAHVGDGVADVRREHGAHMVGGALTEAVAHDVYEWRDNLAIFALAFVVAAPRVCGGGVQ